MRISNLGLAISFVALAGCSRSTDNIECWVPTYDVPDHNLGEAESWQLATMCTENWAKVWAVQSAESAGDIADAVASKCNSTYFKVAAATWPVGQVVEHVPGYAAEFRGAAIAQVIQTRRAKCRKLKFLEKYNWLTVAAKTAEKSTNQ